MKNTIVLAILVFCISMTAKSQSKVEFGLTLIPSFSTINTEGKLNIYKYIKPINFGVKVNFTKNKFSISSGILYMTQGTKFKAEVSSDPNNPESGIGTYTLVIKAKSIIIPLNIDYILFSKNKTELFGGLGLYNGYIFSQQIKNAPFDYLPKYTTIDIFNKYLFQANIGLGLRQFIAKRTILQIRPNFLYQIRKELPRDKYAWTNRLMTFSLDIGLLYRFEKK